MADHSQNTKRIVKNTIFLYIRMLVMMAVSLFTFRELLKELGVDDYGTYNAVGGVVILFSFLSNAMTNANQRFLSFHIGKGDIELLKKTFSMILNVHMLMAICIIFLAETFGLWFVNYKMNFDGVQMSIVNIVYQFTILTFVFQLFQIPFTSSIISHEKMSFFSFASIGESLLRLLVVLSLGLFASGRLVLYAMLLSVSAFIILLTYIWYSVRSFHECKYEWIWDRQYFKTLTSFSGWNMVGGLGNVAAGQGINMLFNIFCGVVANAAMGVSHQVSAAVTSLVSNMQTAFNPQITKSYAKQDYDYFNSLIFRASRLSFFLIFLFGIPIILCADSILSLWLTDVPEYAVIFTQLTIICCIVDALSGSLWTGAQAIGDVKIYTLWLTSFTLLYLPVAYLLLKLGFSPTLVLIARIGLSMILHIYRIIYLSSKCNFPGGYFFRTVTLKAFLSFIIMAIIITPFVIFLNSKYESLLFLPIYLCFSFLLSWFMMLSKGEKDYIIKVIKNKIIKTKDSNEKNVEKNSK